MKNNLNNPDKQVSIMEQLGVVKQEITLEEMQGKENTICDECTNGVFCLEHGCQLSDEPKSFKQELVEALYGEHLKK